MKIIQKFATGSACYKAERKISPRGLMLHSVGCNQPNPYIFAKKWATSDDVCPHAVLGADGTVIQTLPWGWRGWHAGGAANNTHIGVEMCEPETIKYSSGGRFTDKDPEATKAFVQHTYKVAVELFAYLCKKFKLDPLADGVIISHSEGWKRGIASNHGDVEHIWNKYGLTMNQFRKDVKTAMHADTTAEDTPVVSAGNKELYRVRKSWTDAKSQIGAYNVLDHAIKDCKHGYTVYNSKGEAVYTAQSESNESAFKVKVTADALNIRSGAGAGYKITGCIRDKGCYTITETSGNWGKLKSGAGWISLKYIKRL